MGRYDLTMIKQTFDVDGYWEVIIYWNVDYDLFHYIASDLNTIGFSDKTIEEVKDTMKSGRAKAVTCSNHYTSIVLFNKHKSITDYINSMVHEAVHIKQAMLKAYRVKDKGEAPAYTMGYLVGRMWEVFSQNI